MPRKPPPPVSASPTGVYVKLPIPPELAETLSGHLERAVAIWEEVVGIAARAKAVGERAAAEQLAVRKTVKRLRPRSKRR